MRRHLILVPALALASAALMGCASDTDVDDGTDTVPTAPATLGPTVGPTVASPMPSGTAS